MINDNINPISQRTVPVKSVLFAIAFAILSGGLANSQIDDSTPPPLNKEGMVGEWEAITQLPLPTFLLHLEFRLYEPSFLVTRSVGSPVSQVFRLVSSEINDGHVKLRFPPLGLRQRKTTALRISGSRAVHMVEATFRPFERKCGKMVSLRQGMERIFSL